MPTSDFLHEATARGFVFQCTDTEALDPNTKTIHVDSITVAK